MRILYVITDLDTGGVPLHLLRLATGARDAGHDVSVLSIKPAGPVGDRLADAGIGVQSCDASGPADWRVFESVANATRSTAPDVVHSLLFHANLACRIAGLIGGFPAERLVCEIQTAEIERRWHLAVDRLTFRLCRLTVVNSDSVRRHLRVHAGIPAHLLRVIHGGVDAAAIQSAAPLPRESLGAREGEHILLWVGRLDPVKGLDTLIDAVAALLHCVDARLLLVGDGPEAQRLQQRIARRHLEDRASMLGWRSDVHNLMRSVDAFVFPSRTEGMPNALLEAMAAGLPIVTTDVPGCRDLVTHEREGLLVPADDAAALARAIERLIDDAALARRLAEAARRRAEREFSFDACLSRYLALYREILSGPTGM